MGKVLTHMTMSLDGFVAALDDNPGELFEWYAAGDVSVPSANGDVKFDVDEASAEVLRELTDGVGAIISGRHLFDITDGWGDVHPVGAPVVVVTHSPPANAAERWPRLRRPIKYTARIVRWTATAGINRAAAGVTPNV